MKNKKLEKSKKKFVEIEKTFNILIFIVIKITKETTTTKITNNTIIIENKTIKIKIINNIVIDALLLCIDK